MLSTALRTIVTLMLILVSLIHLMPLIGVLGAEHLTSLYGLSLADPNILILMRHRAILFGLLGVFFLVAAFRPRNQPMALVAGYMSVIGFLVLAYSGGNYNAALARVVQADLIALGALVIASICWLMLRFKPKDTEH